MTDTTQITNIINTLADKLNTPASAIFGTLCRQAKISSITWIIAYLILMIMFASLAFVSNKYIKPDNVRSSDDDFPIFCWIGCLAVLAAITVIFTLNLNIILAGFLNPQYWPLHEIISSLR
jgi:hypothetical protein